MGPKPGEIETPDFGDQHPGHMAHVPHKTSGLQVRKLALACCAQLGTLGHQAHESYSVCSRIVIHQHPATHTHTQGAANQLALAADPNIGMSPHKIYMVYYDPDIDGLDFDGFAQVRACMYICMLTRSAVSEANEQSRACWQHISQGFAVLLLQTQLLDHLEIDINDTETKELFARFDPDGSKVISFAEFEAAYGHLQVC